MKAAVRRVNRANSSRLVNSNRNVSRSRSANRVPRVRVRMVRVAKIEVLVRSVVVAVLRAVVRVAEIVVLVRVETVAKAVDVRVVVIAEPVRSSR